MIAPAVPAVREDGIIRVGRREGRARMWREEVEVPKRRVGECKERWREVIMSLW